MKKHRALFSLILAVALTATNAAAQRGGGAGGGGGGGKSSGTKQSSGEQKMADSSDAELQDLISKLTLTDPQKAAVKSVLDVRDAQLAALKKEKLPKDESTEKSGQMKDAANAKIRTFLTSDQQAIFDGTRKKGGKKYKDAAPEATPAATSGPPAASPAPAPAPPAQ